MDRRDFLKTTGSIIAASAVVPGLPAAAQSTPPAKGRVVLPLNRRWLYSPKSTDSARERIFDDSTFARVTVPHTNIRLPWHSFDEKSYEFVSIYRRHFRLPAGAQGRRVFVDFEGVMTASTVWLNGTRLGEYRGGFTPFSFELTQHVDWAGDNVLAVEVDSTERADIPPFGYEIDYLTFGGIYREVSLRLVSPTFIENIFAEPTDVMSGKPSLDIHCMIEYDDSAAAANPRVLEATLYDGDRVAAKATQELAVDGKGTVTQTLHMDNLGPIDLWDLKSPKLYRVEVRLLLGSHRLIQARLRFV